MQLGGKVKLNMGRKNEESRKMLAAAGRVNARALLVSHWPHYNTQININELI